MRHLRTASWISACLLLVAAAPAALAYPRPPAPLPQRKTISSGAEYNAYMAAERLADPAARAAVLEAFVAAYPHSVMRLDALEQAMDDWRQVGDATRIEAAARSVLEADADNVRALAVLAAAERSRATAQADPDAAHRAAEDARIGLARLPGWSPPAEVSDATYRAMHAEMTAVFEGALGYEALTDRDWASAKTHYLRAIEAYGGGLQDDYELAVAELENTPPDATGFWWAAKALSLAKGNDAAASGVSTYASAKYRSYHGAADGWARIMDSAAAQEQPPMDFAASVVPAESPERSASR